MDRFLDTADVVETLGDWSARPGPLYRRLAGALADAISDGSLPRSARLPSERQLATALSVSRATVVSAYDELRSTGMASSRRGSGTRVTYRARGHGHDERIRGGRATSIVQRLVDRPDNMISLARAADPAVPELADAVRDMVGADLPDLLADVGYHPAGLPTLRAAIADHYASLGLPTGSDQVLVTAGAHQAIVLVSELYLRRDSRVVVETPSWPGCLDVFRARGATVTGIAIDDEGIRPDLLANAFAQHRPDLLYLMPTHHNPTGSLMSARRRERIAGLAAQHDVPVLEDNAYTSDIGGQPAPLAVHAGPASEILTVGSLAKSVWAGLRIGWVRADATLISRLAKRKALADLGSPLLDQALAVHLFARLPNITRSRLTSMASRRRHLEALLSARLPDWHWRQPHGGSALWIRLPGSDAAVFAQIALRHGVEVVPGAAMDPDGNHDDHIRLPYTFPVDVLDELVTRLAGAWTELRRHGPLGPHAPAIV